MSETNGKKGLALIWRQKGLQALVWSFAGSVGTFVIMRLFLVTQIGVIGTAQMTADVRARRMEDSLSVLAGRVESVNRVLCLQLTRPEQFFAVINCPGYLYKGAVK